MLHAASMYWFALCIYIWYHIGSFQSWQGSMQRLLLLLKGTPNILKLIVHGAEKKILEKTNLTIDYSGSKSVLVSCDRVSTLK
jgi:hypothetical protein